MLGSTHAQLSVAAVIRSPPNVTTRVGPPLISGSTDSESSITFILGELSCLSLLQEAHKP